MNQQSVNKRRFKVWVVQNVPNALRSLHSVEMVVSKACIVRRSEVFAHSDKIRPKRGVFIQKLVTNVPKTRSVADDYASFAFVAILEFFIRKDLTRRCRHQLRPRKGPDCRFCLQRGYQQIHQTSRGPVEPSINPPPKR